MFNQCDRNVSQVNVKFSSVTVLNLKYRHTTTKMTFHIGWN